MKKYKITLLFILFAAVTSGQNLAFKNQQFELKNVKASVVTRNNEKVLKIERDLEALPFDANNMAATVDEPTYARLKGVNFENGIIEVKVLSRLLKTAPDFARGFIGLAFRINDDNTRFQSIYLRPTNGRAEN